MMMRRGIWALGLVLLGLVGLRQIIATLGNEIDQLRLQATLIEANEIDPTALFYTESKLSLNAGREVARKIQGGLSTKH